MKAFQYLAALGLGAAVTLAETAVPVAVAQTKPVENQAAVESSAQITASAIALVPYLGSHSDSLAVGGHSTTPQVAQVDEARETVEQVLEQPVVPVETAAPSPTAAPEPRVPSLDEAVDSVVQPAVPTPKTPDPNSPLPVDSETIDPVEAEFEQEGSHRNNESRPDPLQPEPQEAAPEDGLNAPNDTTTTDATAEPKPEIVNEGIVSDSSAAATTLRDEQPNLFRPDESSEVSIEANEAISLEMAIETARQNNPGIRVRQLQLEQSLTAIDQARAAYSPQLSVNSSLANNGSLSTNKELFREPDFDLGQSGDSNSQDLTASLSGNVRVDYGIIDPDRKANIRAAEISAEQAKLVLEQDLAALRLTVTQSYYQLQEAGEQVDISEQAVVSAQRSLKDALALEKAGVGTRFAVLQAEVQLANEQQNLVNNLSAEEQSRRQLAQVLSTPEKLNLTASDPIAVAGNWNMTLEQTIIQAYTNRVELDNQLLQRDLSEAQREVALSSKRPSLNAFALVGPGLSLSLNDTNRDAGTDLSSGVLQGNLGYQAGLNFQWLFGDGGASKAAARQQSLNKVIAEENFEAARNQVRLEVETAFYDLAANLRNIDTSEKGVVQAEEALRLARLRFQAGVGTQSEVVDAERDLTTARGNRVTAVLDYNRALVQIQRAIGAPLAAPDLEIPAYVDGEG